MDEILRFGKWKNNAEMIRDAVVPLRHLRPEWSTLDPTWGLGNFWSLWRPEMLVGSDINKEKAMLGSISNMIQADGTRLPFKDNTFDVVVNDGPYKCVSLDTEILTRTAGWATWAEVNVGDEVYTLNHQTGWGEWQPVKRVIVESTRMRRMVEIDGKSHSSLTTTDHRWPVADHQGRKGWTTSSELNQRHRVPLCAPSSDLPQEATIRDAMVELVAWFWTEGHIKGGRVGRVPEGLGYGHICQSFEVNPLNCKRIEAALVELYGPPTPTFPRLGAKTDGVGRWRIHRDGRNLRFVFSADVGRELLRHAPHLIPSFEFLNSLTASQIAAFIETSIDGDGTRSPAGSVLLTQKLRPMAEAFQYACVLAGLATTSSYHPQNGYGVMVRKNKWCKPSRSKPVEVDMDCSVWCVTVENHTWLARRNGRTYFTGNCNGRPTAIIDNRYGVDQRHSREGRHDLLQSLLTEAARVARHRVLAKCQNQVSGGSFHLQDAMLVTHGESLGLRLVDMLLLPSFRSQPERSVCEDCGAKLMCRSDGRWGTVSTGGAKPENFVCLVNQHGGVHAPGGRYPQQHAYANYSTLLVFSK